MNSKLTATVVLVMSVLLCSCGEDAVEPCDLWVASVVVSGRVTDSGSGGPIVNTEVEVMVAESNNCDGDEQWIQSRRAMTDNAGQFSIGLELGNQNGIRCVGVRETNSGVIVRDTFEFVGGCDETGPPGRLNVDVSI